MSHKRDVDRGDRCHGHGSASPVGAAVEELPGVFDAVRVSAEQQRHDVIGEVRHDGEFASVERRVPEPDEPVVRGQAQGDEVAVGTRDDDFGAIDLHAASFDRSASPSCCSIAICSCRRRPVAARSLGGVEHQGEDPRPPQLGVELRWTGNQMEVHVRRGFRPVRDVDAGGTCAGAEELASSADHPAKLVRLRGREFVGRSAVGDRMQRDPAEQRCASGRDRGRPSAADVDDRRSVHRREADRALRRCGHSPPRRSRRPAALRRGIARSRPRSDAPGRATSRE